MIFSYKPKKYSFPSNNKGFSMVEALVGITIAALLILVFTSLITQTIKITEANEKGMKATMYLQELIEIAKDLEQSATTTIFAPVSPCPVGCHPCAGADCLPPVPADTWRFNAGPETIDGFTRSMTISPVSRDPGTYEIEPMYNPMNDSTSTKKVTATITWYDGFQNQTSTLESYLYYYGQ